MPSLPKLPAGFKYRSELIGPAEEDAFLAHVRELPFRDFEFHGYTGKRRVVSLGWHMILRDADYRRRTTFLIISSVSEKSPPHSPI